MGKKINSIINLKLLGLPVPKCVFIKNEDSCNINHKLKEYFDMFPSNEFFTIRTDREENSISCVRLLTATKKEIIDLSYRWHDEGFQIILQEFMDEKAEIKSGNIWLKDDKIIIEGANAKHSIFTNGKKLDVNITLSRFDTFKYEFNKIYNNQDIFNESEIFRLIRLARKVPCNGILEFSFFKNGKLYFWEIKR